MKLTNINEAPSLFFRWLNVNSVDLELPFDAPDGSFPFEAGPYPGYSLHPFKNRLGIDSSIASALPVAQLLESNNGTGFTLEIQPGATLAEPICLDVTARAGASLLDASEILAGAGSTAVIYLTLREESPGCSSRIGHLRVKAQPGSRLTLVKTNLLSHSVETLLIEQEQDSHTEVVSVDFAQEQNVVNYHCKLLGRKSSNSLHTAYLGKNADLLDFNFVTDLFGEETSAHISSHGILRDRASKTMKSTIYFQRGAKAAKGAEQEYVMLLSDEISNSSVPLLLCDEDDVSGEHAASVGRIDEAIMFYLTTRGFTEEQAKNIVVAGYLTPVLDKIQRDSLAEELTKEIERRMVD